MRELSTAKRYYDYRLRNYMKETRDVSVAVGLGIPRSTISRWLNYPVQDAVTHKVFDLDDLQVRRRILNLERRLRSVTAIMMLLIVLVRTFRLRLGYERLHNGNGKQKLLCAIERAFWVLPLRRVLRILGLNSTRDHSYTTGNRL